MMGKNPGNSKGPGGRLWPGLGQLVPAGWEGGSRPLSPSVKGTPPCLRQEALQWGTPPQQRGRLGGGQSNTGKLLLHISKI